MRVNPDFINDALFSHVDGDKIPTREGYITVDGKSFQVKAESLVAYQKDYDDAKKRLQTMRMQKGGLQNFWKMRSKIWAEKYAEPSQGVTAAKQTAEGKLNYPAPTKGDFITYGVGFGVGLAGVGYAFKKGGSKWYEYLYWYALGSSVGTIASSLFMEDTRPKIGQYAGGLGFLLGLGFAHRRGSKWYGYIGWSFLFGIITGTAGNMIFKPAAPAATDTKKV